MSRDDESPFGELEAPPNALANGPWRIYPTNKTTVQRWGEFWHSRPQDAARWYSYLKQNPLQRYSGRVFPLRGVEYQGVWEMEISRGSRLFYTVEEEQMRVHVHYCGPHISPAPLP